MGPTWINRSHLHANSFADIHMRASLSGFFNKSILYLRACFFRNSRCWVFWNMMWYHVPWHFQIPFLLLKNQKFQSHKRTSQYFRGNPYAQVYRCSRILQTEIPRNLGKKRALRRWYILKECIEEVNPFSFIKTNNCIKSK